MLKRQDIQMLVEGVVNSYAQIFFSTDKVFGLILMVCTFFDPMLGLSGLMAVMLSNLFAHLLGFDKAHIREGVFGFNSLLLGMALAFDYQQTIAFWIVLSFAVLLALINQIWINSVLSKHGLPSLSLPFIITIYLVILAIRQTNMLQLVERDIYLLNEELLNRGSILSTLEVRAKSFSFPQMIEGFFLSLGGVFFQAKLVAGIMVGVGLLYHSRIAFSLTLMAFCWAWVCIDYAGAEMQWLKYQAGANFIFLAIAVGCFYIIPSVYSYLAVLLLVPLTIMAHLTFFRIFSTWYLPIYTLAFSFITIAFVAVLRSRLVHNHLHLITIQYYSPEKTVYKSINTKSRFRNTIFKHIQLPFWGQWMVSQGHNGKHTHLGDWSKAFDFIILDEEMKQYTNTGTAKEDYYCYNKPVVAPDNGHIADIVDYVDDNDVAQMNIKKNWGNTIVINHGAGLYSQLSHLKKDSLKVSIGDYVTKGDVIASCGNSGRSPEPHIHFQLQLSPTIGAKTFDYPVAYYLLKEKNELKLKTFDKPEEGQIIQNVSITPLLAKAFGLYPGMKFTYAVESQGKTAENKWEVFTDAYNRTYIYCYTTLSVAYFVNDGTLFYFTDFEGDKKSALYAFYLAAYKVLLGFYKGIILEDNYPLTEFNNPVAMVVQDFAAPFYRFVKADYSIQHIASDNEFNPTSITLQAWATAKFIGNTYKKNNFLLTIQNDRVAKIEANFGKEKLTATCV